MFNKLIKIHKLIFIKKTFKIYSIKKISNKTMKENIDWAKIRTRLPFEKTKEQYA